MELRDKRYNDIRLTFVEDGHKYFDSMGNTYTSTTTLLHHYVKPFDKDYWLKKKAKELGISEKKLEAQWATITKKLVNEELILIMDLKMVLKVLVNFSLLYNFLIKEITVCVLQ